MITVVFKNTSALLISHTIGRLLSLLLTVLILPNYFTEQQIGSYLLAMFVTSLIASITELGMQAPLIREMTLHLKASRHFLGNTLIIRILLSIMAFILMIVTGKLLGYPTETMALIKLLGLAELVNGIAQLFRCVFRAFEKMHYEALTVITERIMTTVVGSGLIILGIDLKDFCVIVLIASFINLVLSASLVRASFTKLAFNFDLAIWRIILVQALPFAIGNIFNLIYFRIDMIMLSKLSVDGELANAWYGLAFTIVNAFTIIPGAFMGAMFPMMSREFEEGTIAFRRSYTNAVRAMLLLGLPLAIGLSVLADKVAFLLFSQLEWQKIGQGLQLLSWSGGLTFLTTVVITVLRATDKRRAFTILMVLTAILNISINFLIVPKWSHIGCSIAMIVSESFLLIAGFIYIHLQISHLIQMGFVIRIIVLSFTMGAGLILLQNLLPLWLLFLAGSGFYLGGIWMLGELKADLAR
ncbi:TPA: flippase [Candidatus Poribacteria bacterium]|nr:flippase [Candidatus Poribacteria bacterium]